MTLLKPFVIIIKSILYYFFDSLALCKTPSPQKNRLDVVLLIRQDAIGDFVMWLDTAKEYRKLYPPEKYKVVLVGNKIWCDLAKKLPLWDEVHPVNVKAFKTLSLYRWNILREVRSFGAKIAIQPTFSREFYHGDSLIRASYALRKVSSVGDMSNRNWLKKTIADGWHTELIPTSTKIMTELERNAEFFQGLSLKPYQANYPKLKFPRNTTTNWWEREYYVLFPGVSTALRQWPAECFAEIADRIYNQTGLTGILDGAPSDKPLAESIQSISSASLEWAGTLLEELPQLLKYTRFVVSGETSAVYIAAALETPVVCVLGGAYFGRFLPYPELTGQKFVLETVSYPMSCYGCNAKCVYPLQKNESAPCVSNISVDAVWEKVVPLLTN
tara:strand:- start:497 stop:1654 length:1158 start_codon:yes stop_codon:yes gene_type:complete